MKNYEVCTYVKLGYVATVKADDEDQAIDLAHEQIKGLLSRGWGCKIDVLSVEEITDEV